jgi:hypothetical protein
LFTNEVLDLALVLEDVVDLAAHTLSHSFSTMPRGKERICISSAGDLLLQIESTSAPW